MPQRPQSENCPPYCICLLCRVLQNICLIMLLTCIESTEAILAILILFAWFFFFSWCLFVVCLETGSHYVARANLKLTEIHLPLPPKRWDRRCAPPHPALFCWCYLYSRLYIAKACPKLTIFLRMALNHDLPASVTITAISKCHCYF